MANNMSDEFQSKLQYEGQVKKKKKNKQTRVYLKSVNQYIEQRHSARLTPDETQCVAESVCGEKIGLLDLRFIKTNAWSHNCNHNVSDYHFWQEDNILLVLFFLHQSVMSTSRYFRTCIEIKCCCCLNWRKKSHFCQIWAEKRTGEYSHECIVKHLGSDNVTLFICPPPRWKLH